MSHIFLSIASFLALAFSIFVCWRQWQMEKETARERNEDEQRRNSRRKAAEDKRLQKHLENVAGQIKNALEGALVGKSLEFQNRVEGGYFHSYFFCVNWKDGLLILSIKVYAESRDYFDVGAFAGKDIGYVSLTVGNEVSKFCIRDEDILEVIKKCRTIISECE